MKSFFAALALVAALASAGPVAVQKKSTDGTSSTSSTSSSDSSPLSVQIERDGNTGIKASFTNCGNDTVKLFVPGSFLDDAAVEKVLVSNNKGRVPFEGVRLRMAPPNMITNDSFQIVQPNETLDLAFDFGQMHDVSAGGDYNITAKGIIPYALDCSNSTAIEGYLRYKSNTLFVEAVNGTEAAITKRDFHAEAKRVATQAGCTAAQDKAVTNALIHCTNLAKDAARAAMLDKTKVKDFFKTTDATAVKAISTVFTKVGNECGTRLAAKSVSKLYCTDVFNSCKPGVLAYTLPSQSYMVNCPLYFDALPSLTKTCHAQDQSTTTLHEMTHLTQIKGTLDWGVYGYDAIKKLTAAQNQNHADTYCLFANSVNLGKTC